MKYEENIQDITIKMSVIPCMLSLPHIFFISNNNINVNIVILYNNNMMIICYIFI
jgi:hypothetical protein